jgi:putative transposase
MTPDPATYPGYRFPAEIISHAVRLYHVFSLSLRDVELILAERGIAVTRESIRCWCRKFGSEFAARLRRHLMTAGEYRRARTKAFRVWQRETCAQVAS